MQVINALRALRSIVDDQSEACGSCTIGDLDIEHMQYQRSAWHTPSGHSALPIAEAVTIM